MGIPALGTMQFPDLWQIEAVNALLAGSDVIVDAPTGAGKTKIFEMWFEQAGGRDGQTVYTVPTRALANEKYLEWKRRGWRTGIVTGDRAEDTAAPLLVATLETQRERLLRGSPPSLLVIDEYQMIAHPTRGVHYEVAVAIAPRQTQLLFLSGSVANPSAIRTWLENTGRTAAVVRTSTRPVPLEERAVEELPVPKNAPKAFWPRLAMSVLGAGLSPLLIFAPRRTEAEKIAAAIAASLSPETGISLEKDWERVLGKSLAGWLQHGVACHHSGVSFAARAGILEPLAKHGHLPFIVATTGLAAGINFGVRSVLVTSTRYFEGERERELAGDELLQMFGRAGRRGLDDVGTVLSLRNGPSPVAAAQKNLTRREEIEWPVLLRLMEDADDPLEVCRRIVRRMFSAVPLPVGLPGEPAPPRESKLPSPGPQKLEMLAFDGVWKSAKSFEKTIRPLHAAHVLHKGRYVPAISAPDPGLPDVPGRICRLHNKTPAPEPAGMLRYGRELVLATKVTDTTFALTKSIRKLLGASSREFFTADVLESTVVPLLLSKWKHLTRESSFVRGREFLLRLDPSEFPLEGMLDPEGVFLLDPPHRIAEVSHGTDCKIDGLVWNPPPGSPLHSWRLLGLVNAEGQTTARGRVFSRFHGGEGLAIAAALEQTNYPMEDLVMHLANLRGGFRFQELPPGGSELLALAIREAFGHQTHAGYLREGLPPEYGENTAEALALEAKEGMSKVQKLCPAARRGDLERARLEWLSMLRHICAVDPPHGVARWQELCAHAKAVLSRIPEPPAPPEISGRWLQRPARSLSTAFVR